MLCAEFFLDILLSSLRRRDLFFVATLFFLSLLNKRTRIGYDPGVAFTSSSILNAKP